MPFLHMRAWFVLGSALALAAGPARGQDASGWRFWDVSDGFIESYASQVWMDGQGRLWVKHGDVDQASVLDGYRATQVPMPRTSGHIYAGPGGAWTLDGSGLRELRDGTWVPRPIAGLAPHTVLGVVPTGKGAALVLQAERLLDHKPGGHGTRTVISEAAAGLGPFTELSASRDGGVWLGAERGVLKLAASATGGYRVSDRRDLTRLGLTGFRNLQEGNAGELFLTGTPGDAKRVLFRLAGTEFQPLATAEGRLLQAWRGGDGAIWMRQDSEFFRFTGRRRVPLERQEGLSSVAFDVAIEPSGAFWVATSQGVLRYAPPFWQTPPEIEDLDALCHGIIEDSKGVLWFACTDQLVSYDQHRWRRCRLPPGRGTNYFQTDVICPLPNGQFVIDTSQRTDLLIFDPKSGEFKTLAHPSGRHIPMIAPRRDGTVWVVVSQWQEFRIDTFDGTVFKTFLDLRRNWKIANLKSILETRNGDLWVGGTSGLGLYRGGKYQVVSASPDYKADGAFAVFELPDGRILAGGRDNLLEFDGRSWKVIQRSLDRVRNIIRTRDGSISR